MTDPRALYTPAADQPRYIPSLAAAIDQAHRILGQSEDVDAGDPAAVLGQAVSLDQQMRVVLAAVAAERGVR